MEHKVITIIVKKRGRKYFDCVIGGYKAKLVINGVSEELAEDTVVKMCVNDLSERSKYGTSLKFEPTIILNERNAEELRIAAAKRKEAEKWLCFAEDDVSKGFKKSNAISRALELCEEYETMRERLDRVKELLAKNNERSSEKTEENNYKTTRPRILFPITAMPEMNVPVNFNGQTLIFESSGRLFYINEDHPSIEGSHLLGYEGELGRYCYYRVVLA